MKLRYLVPVALAAILAGCSSDKQPEKLVIIHTNDTHSQILPTDENLGGVGRRMVLFDSIRAAEPNAIFVDAGDAVQGTLFFNLYGGVVEQKFMNLLGYDYRILGNHEFDNGVDSLAAILRPAKGEFLASNYRLDATPLAGKTVEYSVREVGERRIGFMAVNLDPEGMIAQGNHDGVVYVDAIEAANTVAAKLKNDEHCQLVVAITHIGYKPSTPPGDFTLAQESENIDIIIGGHSHDLIDASATDGKFQWFVPNRYGKEVLVAQAGKAGRYIGKIEIDLGTLQATSSVIRVDERLDSRIPAEFDETLAPYRHGVDSIMALPLATAAVELAQDSQALLNWCTDRVLERGRELAANVDFAMFNKGGIRRALPQGTVTEGEIISMLPFSNYIQVIDIKGEDLLEAMTQMARVGGNGVSANVDIAYDRGTIAKNHADARIISAKVDGKPIDPSRTYRVATIDYVANGGDYMTTMKHHTLVAQSPDKAYTDFIRYLRSPRGAKPIDPPTTARMHHETVKSYIF